MKKISAFLFVVYALFSFGNTHAKEFTSEDEKALVIFVIKSSSYDVLLNAMYVDNEKNKLSSSKGFNVIIGRGSALFGPYSETLSSETSKEVKMQKKKVKPGSYLLINGNGGPTGSMDKGGKGCFAENSKLFTVEAGKVYLLTVPNAQPNKPGKDMDWSLDPEISDTELLAVYKKFRESEPDINSEVQVLPYETVTFQPRMKMGGCHPPKSGNITLLNP